MRNPFRRKHPDPPPELPELPSEDDAWAALREAQTKRAEALRLRRRYDETRDPLVADIIAGIRAKGVTE